MRTAWEGGCEDYAKESDVTDWGRSGLLEPNKTPNAIRGVLNSKGGLR